MFLIINISFGVPPSAGHIFDIFFSCYFQHYNSAVNTVKSGVQMVTDYVGSYFSSEPEVTKTVVQLQPTLVKAREYPNYPVVPKVVSQAHVQARVVEPIPSTTPVQSSRKSPAAGPPSSYVAPAH